jgi:hypothetical protein
MTYLSFDNLITEDCQVDRTIYRAMVYRKCMNDWGAITPRNLRYTIQHYGDIIPILINRKRERMGLPRIEMTVITVYAFGRDVEGVRRARF